VKDKEVDPLGDYIVSPRTNHLFKVSHFVGFQRQSPDNPTVADRRDDAIDNNNLGAGFTPLTFAMDMDWIMFICIKHDDQLNWTMKRS